MDPLFGAIHTRTLLENLLSVIVTHSKDLLMCLDTPFRVWYAFAMNTTDHINMVFLKSYYGLMSRVTTSPISIATVIVNSDAYHQSPLKKKCLFKLKTFDWWISRGVYYMYGNNHV